MRALTALAPGICLLTAACAGYAVRAGGSGPGYDVYGPEPYLLRNPIVRRGALVGFDFEIVYLPNYDKRYRLHAWSGLGAASLRFSFADGWRLTDLRSKTRNHEVLAQLRTLAEHLVPARALDVGQSAARPNGAYEGLPEHRARLRQASMEPVLYRITIGKDGRPTCELMRLLPEDCVTARLPH